MDSLNQWFVHPIRDQFFDFEGRSTVQQYWMFTLWCFIFYILLEIIGEDIIYALFSLILLFPSFSIGARRLHDIGKSGWWQLLWFIPIIGWIIMIVFLVTKGDSGANRYGADPRGLVAPSPVAPVVPTPIQTTPTESVGSTEVPVNNDPK